MTRTEIINHLVLIVNDLKELVGTDDDTKAAGMARSRTKELLRKLRLERNLEEVGTGLNRRMNDPISTEKPMPEADPIAQLGDGLVSMDWNEIDNTTRFIIKHNYGVIIFKRSELEGWPKTTALVTKKSAYTMHDLACALIGDHNANHQAKQINELSSELLSAQQAVAPGANSFSVTANGHTYDYTIPTGFDFFVQNDITKDGLSMFKTWAIKHDQPHDFVGSFADVQAHMADEAASK